MSYDLTMCDCDGALMAVIPSAPMLPRFVHLTDDAVALSDESEVPDHPDHVTTFARVASSVWTAGDLKVGYIGQRCALFVRVAS